MDPSLVELLVCPACHSKVRMQDSHLACEKPDCGLRYPVRDGIPVMIVEEAEKRQEG